MPDTAEHRPRNDVPQQQSVPAELSTLPQQAYNGSRQAPTPLQPPVQQSVLDPARDLNARTSPVATPLRVGPSPRQWQNLQPVFSLQPIPKPQPPFPNLPVNKSRVTADTRSIEDPFAVVKPESALPRPSGSPRSQKPAPS
jgi:hypothetical protein